MDAYEQLAEAYNVEKFMNILKPIAEILARKNADYGDSYRVLRDKYGPVAFHIRLADKISRLEQVDANGALVAGETSFDTIRDIIGYCVLELLYRKGIADLHVSDHAKTLSEKEAEWQRKFTDNYKWREFELRRKQPTQIDED